MTTMMLVTVIGLLGVMIGVLMVEGVRLMDRDAIRDKETLKVIGGMLLIAAGVYVAMKLGEWGIVE